MATLSTLSGDDGPLTKLAVHLEKGQLPLRSIYGLPEFMEGLTNDLPTWECGRLEADQTPQEQMDSILHTWISGRPIRYSRMLKDLWPTTDEVWEFKTADLRIFGWIYRPRVFIAVFLDYADWYKGPTIRETYDGTRNSVVGVRNTLDLDEPKFTQGTFDALV